MANDAAAAANQNYYQNTMKTKRVRVLVEAEVEYRDNDPDYTEGFIKTDWPISAQSVRTRNLTVILVEDV